MTSPSQPDTRSTPRFPVLVATGIFVLAALSLLYPMLSGQILGGSDQINVGYAMRNFRGRGHAAYRPHAAMESVHLRRHAALGGPGPFRRVLSHGVAALVHFGRSRADLGFFVHFVGCRARDVRLAPHAPDELDGGGRRRRWRYELTGILASMVSPGHDGKLFAAALAPFAFVALLRAIRHGKTGSFGWFALVIGLEMLTPHYLAAYYLLIACALFTLWLVFLDPERLRDRSPVGPLAMTAIAVALGPRDRGDRAAAGAAHGRVHAREARAAPVSATIMPPATPCRRTNCMTAILPQFNGVLPVHYWGSNFFKDHTEYVGAIVVTLMILGIPAARKRAPPASIWRPGNPLPAGGVGRPHAVLSSLVSAAQDGAVPRARAGIFHGRAGELCVSRASASIDCSKERLVGQRRSSACSECWVASLSLRQPGCCRAHRIAGRSAACSRRRRATLQRCRPAGSDCWSSCSSAGQSCLSLLRRAAARGGCRGGAFVVVVGADNWSILRVFPTWLPPASVTFSGRRVHDGDEEDAAAVSCLLAGVARQSGSADAGGRSTSWTSTRRGADGPGRSVASRVSRHGEPVVRRPARQSRTSGEYQFSANIWDLYAREVLRHDAGTAQSAGVSQDHGAHGAGRSSAPWRQRACSSSVTRRPGGCAWFRRQSRFRRTRFRRRSRTRAFP